MSEVKIHIGVQRPEEPVGERVISTTELADSIKSG